MEHRAAPAVGQAGNSGQGIRHAHGKDDPTCVLRGVSGLHRERILDARDCGDRAFEPLDGGIRSELHARIGHDRFWRPAILRQKPVGGGGKAVAPQATVEHGNTPASACQLQGGGHACKTASHDGNIKRHGIPPRVNGRWLQAAGGSRAQVRQG